MLNKTILLGSTVRLSSAFPSVMSRTTRSISTTATNQNIQLPAGIGSGDLCIILVSGFYTDATQSRNWSVPSGWTELAQAGGTPASPNRLSTGWFARSMDGTESGSNVVFSTTASNSFSFSAIIWRIASGSWFGGTIADSIAVSAVTETDLASLPSFATLVPPWGALNYLWIASGGAGDDDIAWVSPSTNYDNLTSVTSGGGSNSSCSSGSCERRFNVPSQTPANMSLASSETWRTVTLAVRPAP